MVKPLLELKELRLLRDAAEQARLTGSGVRELLFIGVPHRYQAGLKVLDTPRDQLWMDLHSMNEAGALTDGTIPLQIWVTNAIDRLALQPELARPFERALHEVDRQIAMRSGMSRPSGGLERIIHRNDLLPFRFGEGLMVAARAVARLEVEAWREGQRSPGGFGTAFLVGPDLLLTAAHVLLCRGRGEGLPSDRDLQHQVESVRVRFDFDQPGDAGEELSGAHLLAWDQELDYALLGLSAPQLGRTPLRLAPHRLPLPSPEARPVAVNIIQHPGGHEKRLGIRNNLLAGQDEYQVRYFTDTSGGSSGSPVMTDAWEVIAIHQRWETADPWTEFQGERTLWVNVGTRIDRVLEHLARANPELGARLRSA